MTKGNGQAEAPMAIESLKGDVRDHLLERMKRLPKVWAKMSEGEQRLEISRVEQCADELIHKAVMLIAARERKHIMARVKKVTITDKGCELTFDGMPATDNAALNVALLQGKRVLLIDVSATEFLGERAPAKADPDQPDLLKGEAKGSPFKVKKDDGKPKPPSAVAAEIGDKLIAQGSSVVSLPAHPIAALRQELARAPHRIHVIDEAGTLRFQVSLGDEILRFQPNDKGEWEIVEHVLSDGMKFAGHALGPKRIAAFIREWVAIGEATAHKKPPTGAAAREEAASTGAE